MGFRDDDRGVTVQIGAVLLFGILVIAMATYQVTVVPAENKQVEFHHSQRVQGQLQDVRNGIIRSAGSGNPTPESVSLGTQYPERVLFVNPPPASGTLRTAGTDDPGVNVSVANARVVGGEPNAKAYWRDSNNTFDTGALVYRPGYNVYGKAPTTVYENTVAYNAFDNGRTLELTGQTLVQGNRINLLALRGSLSTSTAGDETVDVRPVSTWTNTVTLESTAADPIFVNFTTRMTPATWENSVLAGQENVVDVLDRGSVTRSGVTYHRVAVRLRTGVAYEFRAGSVGVGAMSDDETTPDPAYLVVTDPYEQVGNGTNGTMTVEVRDKYNNPLSDAAVNVAVDGEHLRVYDGNGSETTATTLRTDADGRATVNYRTVNVTSGGQTAWLNASLPNASAGYQYENVSGIEVPTFAFGDGGQQGELNPGSTGDLIYDSSTTSGSDVRITLNNTLSSQINITGMRLNFYYYDSKNNQAPDAATVSAGGTDRTGTLDLKIGGPYVSIDPKIVVDPTDTGPSFTLSFDTSPSSSRDFFALTIVFEYDGNQYRETYFVVPN